MAIESMRLVRVSAPADKVTKLIGSFVDYPSFHPELASTLIDDDTGKALESYRIYETFLSRAEKIVRDLQLDLNDDYDRRYSKEEIETALTEAETRYDMLHQQESLGSSLNEEDKLALAKIREYPLEGITEEFIAVRFGRLPINSIAKIALHNFERFVYAEVYHNKQYAWILYISLKEDQNRIDAMFHSLYFEPIGIPVYTEDVLNQDCYALLDHVYGYVKYRADLETCYKYIVALNGTVILTGFVPTLKLKEFRELFDDGIVIEDSDPTSDETLVSPTQLRNGWFSRPFESFVEMYGLPHYQAFDPTLYFSLTYCLLFGMMFGDLGQGLVIAVGGWYFGYKKGIGLGKIAVRIGIFSMVFGFIYGSVFGNEEILTPLLAPVGLPIHVTSQAMTMPLLMGSVALGSALILMSMFINVVVSLRHKEYDRALFSQNGLAGLVLYGFVMGGLGLSSFLSINIIHTPTVILFAVVPLALILFKGPLTNLIHKISVTPHEGWSGYFVEGMFELIEVILSFVTNTMSFLRVGGFILSHAGMMSVVIALQTMAGSGGLIVFLVGNAIVIGLEGLIVGIQTLRLEYYEMFSRYYDGGGKKFTSVQGG